MNYRKIIYLCFAVIIRGSLIFADFEDTGLGARPIGMGGAFTAVADDIYAIYYNPAGLAFLRRNQCAAEYGKMYMGLDDDSNISKSFIGYAHPIRVPKDKKRFWKKKIITSNNLPYTDYGTVAAALVSFSLSGEYEERALYVSYARRILSNLSVGLNIKNLYEQYTIDDYLRKDPVFDYGSQNSLQTISFDLGCLYHINHLFSVGLSIWDVNQPDVGLKSTNRLIRQYRLGGAYHMQRFTVALDMVKKRNDRIIHIGMEQWLFKKILGFRLGYAQGSRELKNFSSGLSINMYDVEIGYAFLFPLAGIEDISGSHRINCVFRFGYEQRIRRDDKLSEAFMKIQKENEKLSEEYIHMEKMKDTLERKYLDDVQKQQSDIEKLERREQALMKELRERPVKYIKPKIKKWAPPPKYTVQEGDTLRSIAQKLYGNATKWNDLYKANKDKIKRSHVEPGQILIIPQ